MHNHTTVAIKVNLPRTLSEDSQNEIIPSGHSHEVEKASTSRAGIVKLNDTLVSLSKVEALTANQGRELAERIEEVLSASKVGAINKTLDAALAVLATRYTSAYATYQTARDNVARHPENALIYVVNDPQMSFNGLWTVVGGNLVKAPWDALSSALTSEPFEVLQAIFQGAAGELIVYEGKTYDTLATFTQTLAEGKAYIQTVLADLAQSNNFTASYLLTASGKFQQEINDSIGAKWYSKPNGYALNDRVMLSNGDIVKSAVANNIINPNVDMTGWRFDNNTVESIADLVAIQNPKNGMTIKVKSYSPDMFLKGGGNFTFVANDLTAPNNVNIFAGNGGNWHRLNWKQPSIYDAGLTGDEVDTSLVNTKLQALVDAATANNLSVSLKGKTIKFTELDLPSNLHIYNGTLDATSSTWHLTYGRGAMMFKTTPRGAVGVDYEGQAGYAALEETKNIKFVNVKFKAVEKMGYFYKFDGLQFINCGGEWQTRYLFKFVGGWAGTPLANDTPSSYNLINPINGRNKNILIKGGKWKGGYTDYTFASPFHFVACEEVDIIRSNVDAPLGYHIDIYNKNFRINQANYHNTNAQIVADIINGLAEPDMLAMYIGQNCYGIDVTGGNWINFGKKGLYVEVGSKIVIDGVTAEMTIPNSDTTFIDIQPNYRDNTNTFWGNCADITIRNVKSKGTKYGINTSPYNSVRSIKELHILDAYIQTNSSQQGVVLRGVDTYSLINVQSTGQLFIGGNNFNGNIKGGSFYNAENYALYINDLIFGEIPKIKGTDFIVGSGAVIYNNGGASKDGKIVGGDIYANDFVGAVIANGVNAASLSVMDFEYKGDRHIIYDYTLTVAASAKTSFYYIDARFKVGWSCTANIINADVVGYLDVWANVVNGSIYITIENKSGANINALPIRIILQLFTYASRDFPN